MPRFWSSAPRKKLPPPTTTATWTPRRTTDAIWRATAWTTSGSTPTMPPPNTSPDSLRTTRRGLPGGGAVGSSAPHVESPATSVIRPPFVATPWHLVRGASWSVLPRPPPAPPAVAAPPRLGRGATPGSGLADLEADEPRHVDAGLAENLLDALLVVGDRRLLQQHEVLEERVGASVDDLRQRGLRLAFLASGLLGDPALGLDDLGRHLVAGEVLRTHRGDLHRHPTRVGVAGLVA